jgi:hypothetical protein
MYKYIHTNMYISKHDFKSCNYVCIRFIRIFICKIIDINIYVYLETYPDKFIDNDSSHSSHSHVCNERCVDIYMHLFIETYVYMKDLFPPSLSYWH